PHGEIEPEDLGPEPRGPVVFLVTRPPGAPLPIHQEPRQAHGQLGEQVVVRDGECELETVPEQCVFHGVVPQRSAWRGASTNTSHLSIPRDTSVNRSAVSRSPSSLAWSMPFRAAAPNAARADDSASTCPRPSTAFSGYSASDDRFATIRAVPSATPPSCTARSAMSST